MAIGTTAAILGAAALGAGASILGSSAQSKAADNAADASNQAAQLQYQLGQQSLALQQQLANQSLGFAQDVYGANWSVLSPYVSQGNVAGQYYNALLGLPAAPAIPNPLGSSGGSTGGSPAPAPAPMPPATTQPVSQTPLPGTAPAGSVVGNSGTVAINPSAGHILAPGAVTPVAPPPGGGGQMIAAANAGQSPGIASPNTGEQTLASSMVNDTLSPAARAYRMGDEPLGGVSAPSTGPGSWTSSSAPGQVSGGGANTIGGGTSAPPPAPALGTTPASSPPAAPPPATGGTPSAPPVDPVTAQQAFQTFLDSAGYQFALGEAMNSINHAAAGGGWLQSGAALKALQDRSADIALQGYFMPYMGMLGGQQALGAQAASSIAGVGSNFTNSAANINANLAAGSAGTLNGMGNAAANNAANLGNIYGWQGNNTANMWNSLGSSFGNAIGGLSAPAPVGASYGTGLGYDPISGGSYGFGW